MLQQIEEFSIRDDRILKVKETLGVLRVEEMHLLLRALRNNCCTRTLYLQSCGLRPELVGPLLQVVMTARQIRAVIFGEMAENPTVQQLRAFIQVLGSNPSFVRLHERACLSV